MGNQNPKFINIQAVCNKTCIGKTTLLQWEAEGIFPKAIRLSPHKRVWLEHLVDDWMLAKAEAPLEGEAHA